MLTAPQRPPVQPRGRLSVGAKTSLSVEVVRTYLRVRWLLARRGLPVAVARLRGGLTEHSVDGSDEFRRASGARCGWAVVRVLRLLPTDGRCLMRSLVLAALLARRGIYGRLVIGVRPDASFGAHAWIEVDGQPVLATDEAEFHRLVEL